MTKSKEWADLYRPATAGLTVAARDQARACFCVGPQNGEPLCPCRMRGVQVRDGRYVETIDHGPATTRGTK